MVWRVLMGQRSPGVIGMYMSEPGWDVFSAPDDHLSFSTDWQFGAIVHQTGFILRGTTMFFPALSYTPMVLVSAMNGSNQMVLYYLFGSISPFPGPGGNNSWYQEPLVKVYPNALDFTAWAPNSGQISNGFNFWARYIIFRLPGGP